MIYYTMPWIGRQEEKDGKRYKRIISVFVLDFIFLFLYNENRVTGLPDLLRDILYSKIKKGMTCP